jgi:glutamate carboxypeptidase
MVLEIADYKNSIPKLISRLRTMVEIESPTYDKKSVDEVGAYISEIARSIGGHAQRYAQTKRGDHWTFQWGTNQPRILLMTHMDTVYPLGTLEEMPWREEGNRLYGPGVLDMKVGIALALTAIEIVQGSEATPSATLLCTSDEETGSKTSRELIERLAGEHDLVLCLEPSLPGGALKTWRKGIGTFWLEAEGIPAHAGSDPNPGVNAILEMAHQLLALSSLPDREKGITLNYGRIRGGTRTNVVAEKCRCSLDIRIKDEQDQGRISALLNRLAPINEGAKISVTGGWNRPPMQRTQLIQDTFLKAKEIAKGIGIHLSEGGTGGGSDANFVAALGIPVLDGLGATGEGAHSRNEYIELASMAERAALLGAILTQWS